MDETLDINTQPIPRATIEDLLGLPVEGWKAIAEMNDEQLAIYLKDICDLEPKIDPESRPNVKEKDSEDDETQIEGITESTDNSPKNPFDKKQPSKKSKTTSNKTTTKLKNVELGTIESIFKNMDIDL